MTQDDLSDFSAATQLMVESFGRQATKAQITGFWMVLEPYPFDLVRAAIQDAMRTEERLPVPSDLAKRCQRVLDRQKRRWKPLPDPDSPACGGGFGDTFRAALQAKAEGRDVAVAINEKLAEVEQAERRHRAGI